ncbi:MAG: DegT/DnrJ/EryC1/StrS aminotransferase family protein [Chloroflexi bacterium]|nr:DegT/DnrJ/EryC1/StrS aminotransferase family protein [Chloroflexota bacterium]
MRDAFLSFSPPLIGDDEISEVLDTLRSDWITTGPKVRRFEQEFAAFIGAPAAAAVSSATDAMLVGLAALGVGPGDEVITTPMTFCSTVHVIEHLNARPVLVDVAPDTLNIDPEQVARAITSRTRGIMPVHLYGHPCEMDALHDLANRHNLFILEDAAHALPARYKGRMIGMPRNPGAGNRGQLTAFSFYATKNLTTAEGGMLTGEPELIDRARIWSLHGMSRDAYKRYSAEGSWYYEVVLPGFKCNMTDIQAALGLQQLRKLPGFQARRRQIVRRYNEAFASCDALQTPVERPEVESAWHIYALRLNLERLTIDRARFIEELKARNIGVSVHFIPIHLHPYYRDKYEYKPDDFPVAYREYQRLISLPLNLRMNDGDVQDVIDAVLDIAERYRR